MVNLSSSVPATKYKKPPVYDGTSSWHDYFVQFELLIKINKWTVEEQAMELATSLRGSAEAILSDLSAIERVNFDCLTSALAARFEPTNQSEIYRSKMKSRIREKGESLPELVQDIKRLVRFAYPSAKLELRDQLAIDCFIDALGDEEMKWCVHQKGPESVAQSVSIALKYEAFYASRKKQGIPRVVRAQSEDQHEDGMVGAVKGMEHTVNKLAELVEKANKEGTDKDKNSG